LARTFSPERSIDDAAKAYLSSGPPPATTIRREHTILRMFEPAPFLLGALYSAVDAAHIDRGLSWSAVSRQVGVAASTIRRFSHADDAEADGVLTLISWLGIAPEEFIDGELARQERLASLDGGMVRADLNLINELLIGDRSQRLESRMTIQRLTTLAQSHSRTVASLTRWSPI
jgi:hypothetical protein